MNYLIAVFASRHDAMAFHELLKGNRINCVITNTPKQIEKSCGISVKTELRYFQNAQVLLSKGLFQSFKGFYIEKKDGYERL